MDSKFSTRLFWSGAWRPRGTAGAFSRDLSVSCGGQTLPMSAAPDFHGDPSRVNPEQLFVASLSACQALTYLFLAVRHAVVVVGYSDEAEGTLASKEGRIQMTRVVLRPRITVADEQSAAKARELVAKAHQACFIANSITATVDIEPAIEVDGRCAIPA